MANLREYEMLFKLNAQLGSSYNSSFKSAQQAVVSMQKEIDALNKVQSNISAYEKQQSSIEATRRKLEILKQQYNNIQKEIKETGEFSSALQNKLLSKQQQIDKTSASVETQTHKLNQLGDALREAGVDTEALRSEEAKLESQITDLKQKQEQAAESAQKFGATASNAMNAAGQALISSGILYGLKQVYDEFADIAEASMEYQSALTGVAKTTDLSSSELATLSEEVKDLSTDIPVIPTELLEIAESAGQLGIAKDHILDFSEVMANLGVATNMTSDQAATDLAKFANVVKMSADDYERLGSTIVDLGNKGASTESEIVSMATRLASTGSLIGLSEAEIMAISSSLSSLGIEAEAGGSAISKLLKEFEVMVETKSPALKDFAKVAGMSAKEFSAAWGENSVEALGKFINGLGKIDAEGGSAVATLEDLDITEIRMSNAVLALASSGGILTDNLNIANRAWEENTALAKEAERRYEDTKSKLTMMQNAFTNLKVAVGDNYNPALAELYELNTQVLGGLRDFIEANPAVVKGVTTTAAALGSVIAGLTAYAAVSKIAAAATALMTSAIPGVNVIMAVSAGVAVLAGGLVAFSSTAESKAIPSVRDLTKAAREMSDAINESNQVYEESVDSTLAVAGVAETYIGKLEDLEATGITTDEQARQYHDTLALLCEVIPELSSYIDLENDTINGGTEALRKNTEAWKENAIEQAYQAQMKELNKKAAETELEKQKNSILLTKAQYELEQDLEDLKDANGKMKSLKRDEIREDKLAIDAYKDAIAEGSTQMDAFEKEIKLAEDAMESLRKEQALYDSFNPTLVNVLSQRRVVHGSHAAGLDYVPFDGYIAELHQGERVQTAAEARMDDTGGGRPIALNYSPRYEISGGNTAEIESLLREHDNNLRDTMMGWLEDAAADSGRRAYR